MFWIGHVDSRNCRGPEREKKAREEMCRTAILSQPQPPTHHPGFREAMSHGVSGAPFPGHREL